MRYGITLPIFDELADPKVLADLAAEAEAQGWDGAFVWDHVFYREPAQAATDPWVSLAAMAVNTSRVRLGPMVTPLARRRPQIVARQAVALDRLSGGRLVLGTGLGLDGSGREFERFGEVTSVPVRAEMYDEALGLVRELVSGALVDHDGPHFTADHVRFLPRPVQPSLPIWVAAQWPNRRPLDRAVGQDGVCIINLRRPDDLRAACEYVRTHRAGGLDGFEIVVQGPAGSDPAPWADAGATWWLSAFDPFTVRPGTVRSAIRQGPTR
ncbi:MAG: LLM class flavin-dependent oxidoreductase [Acidimicrobiales bacterium]|nr:LLM class flavin-dependent oxidoreductase [Acidimicrobiales bacterium]